MVRYGVVWHPMTDNLGDDLQALAAMRLMPRVDHVLDGERLDAPIDGVKDGDRVITLLSGNVFRRTDHWPPEKHIVPVCAGMHFSQESVWGIPLTELSGAGLAWLKSFAPIGCRDTQTYETLKSMRLPVTLNGCATLTLQSAREKPKSRYICCVDVPDEVLDVLRQTAKAHGVEVRVMTHQRIGYDTDFDRRMQHAQWMVDEYAGAQFIVTRRLHAAMAGVAVDTPTLLLYHASYEDVTRFAPMDSMINSMPVEEFVEQVHRSGFPALKDNPAAVKQWRRTMADFIQTAMQRAEACPMSPISDEAAEQWRRETLAAMVERAEKKIRRLEKEHFASLHEKFSLLLREDHVRASFADAMEEKAVQRALRYVSRGRALRKMPWHKRPAAWLRMLRGAEATPDLAESLRSDLNTIGWPDHDALPGEGRDEA